MSDPALLLDKCRRLGLELWVEGNRIGIAPKQRIPTGLLEEIREAKSDLLAILRHGQTLQLSVDRLPWLHVARQVLDGEFQNADRSTVESLVRGLRGIDHPVCQKAMARLKGK
jgi:hypothetical protein